jgi:hypothetical protein
MSAFLMAGWVSQFRQGRYGEWCSRLILHGGDQSQAAAAFEALLLHHEPSPDSSAPKIEKITSTPIFEQLLAEQGPANLELEKISEEALAALQAAEPGDLGDGLWADSNALVPAGGLDPDIDSLKRDLPGDEAGSLNWSADKQMIFIVNVLTPPTPVRDILGEELTPDELAAHEQDLEMRERQAAFPEIADRELAVIVRARNAIVAAWLWRRQAASTPLASHDLRVDAFCEVMPLTSG